MQLSAMLETFSPLCRPCVSCPWCSYLFSCRCLIYTGWRSTSAICATVLFPPRLLLQKAVWHWDPLFRRRPWALGCLLLEGRDLILFSDHKPLSHALFRTTPPWSASQQRQLSFISKLTSNIIHLPGVENSFADALSRPSSVHLSSVSYSSPSALTSNQRCFSIRQARAYSSLSFFHALVECTVSYTKYVMIIHV